MLPAVTPVVTTHFSTLSPKWPFWVTLLLSSLNSRYPDLPLGKGCTCSPTAHLCAFAHTLYIQKPGPSIYNHLTFVLELQHRCQLFQNPSCSESRSCLLSTIV